MLSPALRLPAVRLPKLEARQWATSLMLAAVFALNLVAGIGIIGLGAPTGGASAKVAPNLPAAVRDQAPPAPEPLKFREIPPQDAVAINEAVPISDAPNPPARPFVLNAATEFDKMRAIECLTSAIYYEAAVEPLDGQRAVAQVVLNRARHPAYPNSVCGVVFQGSERSTGCQFTFTCDGALARTPHAGLWRQARQIAEAALAGAVYKPVGWATHYHTDWVVPYWSSSLVKAAKVGTHIFYRWTGGWGTGPAFRTRYAGAEPTISKMKHLTAVPAAAEMIVEGLVDAAGATLTADGVAVPAAPAADMADRNVIRRFEPATAEGVAKAMASRTKPEAVTASYRWALTGGGASKEAPLGRKTETPKADPDAAKPAAPKELEGVRKVGDRKGAALP